MIEYKEVERVVKESSISKVSKSVGQNLDAYNRIMDLEGKDRLIWYDWITQTCDSMADMEQSIAVGIKEYNPEKFDEAIKVINPKIFELSSAYAVIANYIRRN